MKDLVLLLASIFVLNDILLTSADTTLKFELSPNDDHLLLTKAISMRCTVKTTWQSVHPMEPTALPPTNEGPTSMSTDDQMGQHVIPRLSQGITHVISMVVKRDNVQIAMVTQNMTATALVDQGRMKVSAQKSKQPGNGFLEMSWPYPTSAQSGMYVCEVKARDTQGQLVVLNRTLELDMTPTLDILTEEVHDLHMESDASSSKIDRLSEDFDAEKNTIRDIINSVASEMDAPIQSINNQITQISLNIGTKESDFGIKINDLTNNFGTMNTSLSDRIDKLSTEMSVENQLTNKKINNIMNTLNNMQTTQNQNTKQISTVINEIGHIRNVQTGTLDFHKSSTWKCCEYVGEVTYKYVEATVYFKPKYDRFKPPAVQFGIIMSDVGNQWNERIMATLVNVNTESFTLRVRTWANSIIHGVSFNWMSVSQGTNILDDEVWQ